MRSWAMCTVPLSETAFAKWQHRLVVAAMGAVLYRVATVLFPHPAATDPAAVRLTAGLLGLLFLGCGLWAFHEARDRSSLLFAIYCVTACLHWGGPMGLGPDPLPTVLLGLYLVAGVLLNQTLLLHVALGFPRPFAVASNRGFLSLLYLPTAIGVVLMAGLTIPSIQAGALGLLGAMYLVATGLGVAGGVLFIVRLFRADSSLRRRRRLWTVVGALVFAVVVEQLGALAPAGQDGWFNLAIAAEPVALALALARPLPDRC